jgi:AraC-like DNA-binding protein
MDVLSEVLSVIRLTGAVFLDMEMHEEWAYVTAPARAIADVLLPTAEHVIPFHLLMEGSCFVGLADGGERLKLRVGDVILFPAGDRHLLAAGSEAALRQSPVEITGKSLEKLLKRGAVMPFQNGGSGPTTRIACGYLACDRRLAEPMLSSLPRMLKVSTADGETAAWLHASIGRTVAETRAARQGSTVVLSRLAEVMFAEAIGRYLEASPPGATGWLAGLRDRYVGKTLALLHADPARSWTVDELARNVGLSRSALAERFNALVGAPPMQYLTRWRISLAATRLRESNAPITRVAADVGYESEGAFNRAFKRELGLPPATWRKREASAH